MFQRWLFLFIFTALSFLTAPLFAEPILMELAVDGTPESPFLDPKVLTFEQNQEYLIILNNDNLFSVHFKFENFGQNIFTHYLKGTSDVSQSSISVPPQTKVLWLFVASTPGEFPLTLNNPVINKDGPLGKIIISALASTEPTPDKTVKTEVKDKKEEKALKSKQVNPPHWQISKREGN